MPGPKIELEVQFKQQRESLTQLRKDVEAALRTLKVTFDKDSLKQLTDSPLSVRGAGAGRAREAVETQLSRKIGVLDNQLAQRRAKEAETSAKLAAAKERLAAGDKEAASEIGRLTASLNRQKKSTNKLTEQENELTQTLALVDRLFKQTASVAKGMQFFSSANSANLQGFKGVRNRETAITNKKLLPQTPEEKATSDRSELDNIQGNRALAKATADAITYRRREFGEIKKQFDAEQQITTAIQKRVDAAFKRAHEAEQAAARDMASVLIKAQQQQAKNEQKITDSQGKIVDSAIRRAHQAEVAADASRSSIIIKNQKDQEKAANDLSKQISRQVNAATVRAHQAEQAAALSSQTQQIKQQIANENEKIKKQNQEKKKQEDLNNAISKQVDVANRRAHEAEQAGIKDRASFLLKQKAEADAQQANQFFKARQEQENQNKKLTEAIGRQVDTAIKRANQAERAGEGDRAGFLFKQKAEADAQAADAFFKERQKQQKDNKKLSEAISAQVDAAFKRAHQAEVAGEKDRGEFFVRQLEKHRKDSTKEEQRQADLRKSIADKLLLIDRATAQRVSESRRQSFLGGRGGSGGGGGGGGFGPPSIGGGPPDDFNKNVIKALPLIEKIKSRLSASDRAAVDFGEAAKNAALRLGAWATPSIFMFKTLQLLRDAVDQVISLDSETRRLVFFQTAGSEGGLADFNKQISNAATKTKLLTNAFGSITKEAERTGLTINEVVLAANTVARIGQEAFDFKTGASSEFLKATLALTKLEGGLLSADRAAEILSASLVQFQIPASDVATVAAKIATTANETSFSIEELGTVMARFGSAALNVQNLTFDQTLSLASIAGKTLGTNASRAATALRQLTTKIADNATEVERLTGIQFQLSDTGQLKGGQALLDVIERIGQLRNTGAGEQLAKLIGDRENLSDIFALSTVIPQIRKSFSDLNDEKKNAARSSEQVAAFFNQEKLASESARSAINRLDVAFTKLAESVGTKSLVKTFADGFTTIINFANQTVNSVGFVEGALKKLEGVGTVVAANLTKKLLLSAVGAFGNNAVSVLRSEVSEGLKQPFQSEGAINKIRNEGLVSDDQASAFLKANNTLKNQEKELSIQIAGEEKKLNALRAAGTQFANQAYAVQHKILRLEEQRGDVLRREANIRKAIDLSVSRQSVFVRDIKQNAGVLISSTAAFINAEFTDSIANAFTDPKTKESVRQGLGSALRGVSFGAEIGSLFGPKGALVGGLAGGLVGIIKEGLGASAKTLRDIAIRGTLFGEDIDEESRREELGKQLEVVRKQNKAREFAKRQIQTQRAFEREAAEKQGKTQLALFDTEAKIQSLEEKGNKLAKQGLSTKQVQAELDEQNGKRRLLLARLSQLEVDQLERQLDLEQDITAARAKREFSARFSDIGRDVSQALAKLRNNRDEITPIQIGLEFDKKKVREEIENLQQEGFRLGVDISRLGDDPKNRQDRLRLEGQRAENEKQTILKRLEVIDKDREAAHQILEIHRKAASEVLDAYREGAANLNEALKTAFEQNNRILAASAQIRDQQGTINRFTAENPERGILAPTEKRLIDEIKSLSTALSGQARQEDAARRQRTSERFFNQNGSAGVGLRSDVDVVLGQAIENLKLLSQAEREAKDSTNLEAQARVELLRLEAQKFGERIDRERQFLDEQAGAIEKVIGIQIDRYNEEKKVVDILKERAKREADLGKSVINDPRQFFEDVQNLIQARQLTTGINTGKQLDKRLRDFDVNRDRRLNQNELQAALPTIAKILDERIGKLAQSNVGVLQKILKGLEFGGRFGAKLGGIDSSVIEDLIGRALVQPGKDLADSIKSEQQQVNAIEAVRQQVISSYQQLQQVTSTRVEFEKALGDFEKKRVEVLQTQFDNVQRVQLPEALNKVKNVANSLEESLVSLDGKLKSVTDELAQFISGLSPRQIQEFSEKIKELLSRFDGTPASTPKGVGGGTKISPLRISQDSIEQITTSLRDAIIQAGPEFVNTLNTAKVNVSVPDIQVQLNANIKKELQGDDFILKLSEALRESGLEDRVEQISEIVKKLVLLEVNRGSDVPLPE